MAVRLVAGHLSSEMMEVTKSAFSRSTWSGRSRVILELLRRMQCKFLSRLKFATATEQFLEQRLKQVKREEIKAKTLSKDIPHIKWAWQALDLEMPLRIRTLLQTAQRGLSRAPTMVSKALPLDRDMLMRLVKRLPKSRRKLGLVLLLAFETASRVDDIFKLDPLTAFRLTRQGHLLVLWGATKANQSAEARADHQQIVENPGALKLLCRRPEVLLQSSPMEVLRVLRQFTVPKAYVKRWQALNPTIRVRNHLTLHSLKRGRGYELWLDAANGRIQVPEVLHRMKHKSIEAALAYAPDPALAAEAIHKYNQGTRKPLPSVRRH